MEIVVCETRLVLAVGGTFMVPRGNHFEIKNISANNAKLFFVVAHLSREVDEVDAVEDYTPPSQSSKSPMPPLVISRTHMCTTLPRASRPPSPPTSVPSSDSGSDSSASSSDTDSDPIRIVNRRPSHLRIAAAPPSTAMRTAFSISHTGGNRVVSQQVPERTRSLLPPPAFETPNREASVVDFQTGAMVTISVAFTQAMFAPTTAKTGRFLYEKIFRDGEFIEGGQIVIPPNGVKPTKSVKEGTFVCTHTRSALCVRSAPPYRYSMYSRARWRSLSATVASCSGQARSSWSRAGTPTASRTTRPRPRSSSSERHVSCAHP